MKQNCLMCGNGTLQPVPIYEGFNRITSDCRPWKAGGELVICEKCGGIQKPTDGSWQSECKTIYDGYSIYHQSGGTEQTVFVNAEGAALSRSRQLLRFALAQLEVPNRGRLLDVGCGNGALLRTFNELRPMWRLVGTELSKKYQADVESIPGLEAFYSCNPEEVTGRFDLISMVHVLEHVDHPVSFLQSLSSKWSQESYLIVEVPDYSRNPFDLLIADHCSHFSRETLEFVLSSAGYRIRTITGECVPKELTAIAQLKPDSSRKETLEVTVDTAPIYQRVASSLRWLQEVADTARQLLCHNHCGLFGTSIAGTWLSQALNGAFDFFVDEDRNRVGKTYMGKPILYPTDVPTGSQVFIGLPPHLAQKVYHRLQSSRVTYLLPPSDASMA